MPQRYPGREMGFISVTDANNYFPHVSGSFQIKADDRELYVGIAFSDPVVGSFKLNVDLQSEEIDIRKLWEEMEHHEPQTLGLHEF